MGGSLGRTNLRPRAVTVRAHHADQRWRVGARWWLR